MDTRCIDYSRAFGKLTVDCGQFDYSMFANCSEYVDFKSVAKHSVKSDGLKWWVLGTASALLLYCLL